MMAQVLVALYLAVGAILLVLLAGFEGPTITRAFRRDLRTLRQRGSLALVAGSPLWVAAAVFAWPVVATCEAIMWCERA
jgi:hypothetical protein